MRQSLSALRKERKANAGKKSARNPESTIAASTIAMAAVAVAVAVAVIVKVIILILVVTMKHNLAAHAWILDSGYIGRGSEKPSNV